MNAEYFKTVISTKRPDGARGEISYARHRQGVRSLTPPIVAGLEMTIVFVFFILHSVFFMQPALAQRLCATDADCAGIEGLLCVSGRCNLPPPIWNVSGTGLVTTGQNARLFLTGTGIDNSAQVGNLQIGMGNQINNINNNDLFPRELAINWSPANRTRLGRGFTVYDGNVTPWFRVDADGIVSVARGLNVGTVSRNAADGELMVGGNITLDTLGATVDGLNLDNALTSVVPLTGGGITITAPNTRTRVISLLQTCANDQILKWNDATSIWACAADATGAGGSGGTLTGTGAAGQLAFWTGASALGTDSGLVWNVTANRLGIGIAAPTSSLDVLGDVRFSGTLQAGSVPWSRLVLPEISQCDGPNEYVRAITANGVTCGIPATGGGGGLGLSGGVADKVAFWTGASSLGQNANLHFDPVSGRMGIGTAAPNERLEVRDDSANAARLRITDTVQNPELQLQYGAGADNHWAIYYNRDGDALQFWRDNDLLTLTSAGDLIVEQGNLSVGGCLGPVVVGATTGTVNGNLNGATAPNDGYRGVDGLCNTGEFIGSHQCTTNEVLTSIHCGAIWTDGAKMTLRGAIPAGAQEYVWISNGAPSLPTPTNDCYGWTQTGSFNIGGQPVQSQGIAWNFSVTGGGGYARPCNERNRVLCCL